MDEFIHNFLVKRNFGFLGLEELGGDINDIKKRKKSRHVGSFEETIMTVIKGIVTRSMKQGKANQQRGNDGLALYARFHSFYDAKCIDARMMPGPGVMDMSEMKRNELFNTII